MKPSFNVFIEGKPIQIDFVPNVYQVNGEIIVNIKDSEDYEEKLNDQITLYKDVKTHEIVGVKIHYIENLP